MFSLNPNSDRAKRKAGHRHTNTTNRAPNNSLIKTNDFTNYFRSLSSSCYCCADAAHLGAGCARHLCLLVAHRASATLLLGRASSTLAHCLRFLGAWRLCVLHSSLLSIAFACSSRCVGVCGRVATCCALSHTHVGSGQ